MRGRRWRRGDLEREREEREEREEDGEERAVSVRLKIIEDL